MSLNNEGAQNLKQSDKETCEDRITEAIISRGEDFKRFMNAEDEETTEEFYNYGLCIDMVTPGTFKNTEPYLRYQISYGGPSEELRFYQNGTVEFWFLDWWDGAHKNISGLSWVQWLKEHLQDCEILTNEAFFKAWEDQ